MQVIRNVMSDPDWLAAIKDQDDWVDTSKALVSLGYSTPFLLETGEVLNMPKWLGHTWSRSDQGGPHPTSLDARLPSASISEWGILALLRVIISRVTIYYGVSSFSIPYPRIQIMTILDIAKPTFEDSVRFKNPRREVTEPIVPINGICRAT